MLLRDGAHTRGRVDTDVGDEECGYVQQAGWSEFRAAPTRKTHLVKLYYSITKCKYFCYAYKVF